MGMKTEYRAVTTVEEALNYIGDSKEVAFDFETAPDDAFREEDKAALDPAKSHIVTMSIFRILIPVTGARSLLRSAAL